MKLALFLLAVLPFTLGASIDEKRLIEGLLGGYDILELARTVLSEAGCDETEAQCEGNYCPPLLDKIDGHNQLLTTFVCRTVCSEAQVLAKNFGTPGHPCVATSTVGV